MFQNEIIGLFEFLVQPLGLGAIVLGGGFILIYYKFRKGVITKLSAIILGMVVIAGIGSSCLSYMRLVAPGLSVFLIFVLVPLLIISFIFSIYYLYKSVIFPLVELVDVGKTVAEGDLTIAIKYEDRDDEIGSLLESFSKIINYLRSTIEQILETAGLLTSSSQEMASSSSEVNASSEEISSITQQMSRGAQQQTDLINTAVMKTQTLSKQFLKEITNIEAASELIEALSGQVNMLALNASIEAARAGEYGRGFAVVADNIRRLADETKTSLGDINQTIQNLNISINKMIDSITDSVQSAASISEETAVGAEEASAATEEQAATMEEMSASSQELAKIAAGLEQIITQFRV